MANLTVSLKNAPAEAARWQLVLCDWNITTLLGSWGTGLAPEDPDNIGLPAEFEIPEGDWFPLRIVNLSIYKWSDPEHTALTEIYRIQSQHELLWDWDQECYCGDPDPTYREVFIPDLGEHTYNVARETINGNGLGWLLPFSLVSLGLGGLILVSRRKKG